MYSTPSFLLLLLLVAAFIGVSQFYHSEKFNQSTLISVQEEDSNLLPVIGESSTNTSTALEQKTEEPPSLVAEGSGIPEVEQKVANKTEANTEKDELAEPESLVSRPGVLPPKNDSIGACLLVKDKNVMLAEWIAFHYVTLPLRFLVIGYDEHSTQDPRDVAKRWNTTNTNMTIWVWEPSRFLTGVRYKYDNLNHRLQRKQGRFTKLCSLFFKRQNFSWVAYVDVDEFITLHPVDPSNEHFLPDLSNISHIRRFRKEYQASKSFFLKGDSPLERYKLRKWMVDQPATLTVLDVIRKFGRFMPCHLMHRLKFSAERGSSCHEELESIPEGVEVSHLLSATFHYHVHENWTNETRWGKVLANVNVFNESYINVAERINTPHQPFPTCVKPPFIDSRLSPFSVHHYLGFLNNYVGADDRKSFGDYDQWAHFKEGPSCNAIGWLRVFYDTFGRREANRLLEPVNLMQTDQMSSQR